MNILEMFGMPSVSDLMLQERGNYRNAEVFMTNPELIVGIELS